MQTDWPSLLVALLLAVGCYYIVQQFVFPPTVVAGVLGIGSGLGAAAVIEMVLREKLDLCKNGVVLVRWPFLPWSRIRVLKLGSRRARARAALAQRLAEDQGEGAG